mmetsp:Transcript_1965/g.4248  ORF Transcript_1965/g.4248 Transcript_1965/m.4248 type:complete len:200 (+) Transcript_1965:60-659(+)
MPAETTSVSPFSALNEDLVLQIVSYLPPKDLLQCQCVSPHFSGLDTDTLWKDHCRRRWDPWPRYRMTQKPSGSDWKKLFYSVEKKATRTELTAADLNLRWYISFTLSGVRGETRSDLMEVFFRNNYLVVPGFPPLPYEIKATPPPSSAHLRDRQRGDRPFSTTHWLSISDFPPHFITRKRSNAEWLITNENVMLISSAN